MQKQCLNIGRVLRAVSIVLLSAFVVWFAVEGRHWSTAPSLGDAKDFAQRIVNAGRGPEHCFKIFQLLPSYPSHAEKEFYCVRSYAEITKDPSACELLMPSSYGLSCVGAAEDFDPCIMLADQKKTVKGQGIETTFEQCQSGTSEVRKHVCCSMARVLYDDGENCSLFPDGELKDQCHHIVAVKGKDLDTCKLISNVRNRTGCEVIVRAYVTGKL